MPRVLRTTAMHTCCAHLLCQAASDLEDVLDPDVQAHRNQARPKIAMPRSLPPNSQATLRLKS
eukprot:4382781-Pleurochrysis_carterae.AAC.1